MPSPFPGMDPWLEGEEVFPDLHERLLIYISEALNAAMPPGYVATTKTRVWVDDEQRREPDGSVFGSDRLDSGGGVALATLPGMTLVAADPRTDPWTESYLEIVSPRGRRLVTAVEVLSLSNKKNDDAGRIAYREKQEEYRLGGVHVVEIDLLRGGTHTTAVAEAELERITPGFDYHVCVAVATRRRFRPQRFVAAFRLADRLPAISVPLDPDVPPVTVELQPLLDRAYDTGRYAQLAGYADACHPRLSPDQRTWADGLLRAAGRIA